MANKKHIRFDWAIKRLLRHKANFTILEGFLSELLMFDVKIQEIIESEGNQEHEKDKYNKVDILVKDTDDNHMLIELRNEMEKDYFYRLHYGQEKHVYSRLSSNNNINKISKVYTITIVYFPLGTGDDYIYVSNDTYKGMHLNDELKMSEKVRNLYQIQQVDNVISEHYLIRLCEFNGIINTPLDEWIYYLKNCEIKHKFIAKGLQQANKEIRKDDLKDYEKEDYDNFIKLIRIRNAEFISAFIDGLYNARQKYEQTLIKRQEELDTKKQNLEQQQIKLNNEKLKFDNLRKTQPISNVTDWMFR